MNNVIDMRTKEPLDTDIRSWINPNGQEANNTAPPEAEVCEAVKQYRIQKEVEAHRRKAGWPEAVGLGLLLNLLGIF